MAKYFISVIDRATGTADQGEMAAVDVFNDKLRADGHFVMAVGLAAPSAATTIDARGQSAVVTDGPFAELEEYLSGFWIIEAPDRETALRLASEGSKACNRRVELRPFHQ
ncbi:MAG: YciI family protein [Trueperaceae bacterium]